MWEVDREGWMTGWGVGEFGLGVGGWIMVEAGLNEFGEK